MILPLLSTAPAPAAAPRPQPGTGTRLRASAEGYSLSAVPGPSGVRGKLRFVPRLVNRDAVLFTRGTVNGVEPRIGDKRMSQTALRLSSALANADGESWLCVEVEAGELGIITKGSRIEVIHTSDPSAFTPTVGRHALAVVVWKGKDIVLLDQCTHWNLVYDRIQESATFARHIFR